MSSATTVMPPDSLAAPDVKNGRANARASSTSAAIRSASSSELANAPFLGVLDGRLPQQANRRKLHARLRLPLEEMQRDGNRGRQGPQQKQRRQERHSDRPLVERYDIRAISSGSAVLSR